MQKMKQTVEVDRCVAEGDLSPIRNWLRENIWQYGCLYKPSGLLDRVLGEPFDPMVYVAYLDHDLKEILAQLRRDPDPTPTSDGEACKEESRA